MTIPISRRDFIITAGSISALALTSGLVSCSLFSRKYDILIKNGLIIDGTGAPPFSGSVGIVGDVITAVGDLKYARGSIVIEAGGKVISPGFINIHCHTGIRAVTNAPGMSSILQGVTTEIAGQCGSSPAPTRSGRTLGSLLDEWAQQPLGLNIGTMVGHGTIRSIIIGQANRKPTAEELSAMRQLVEESLQGGTLGFSSGLEYTPGVFADTNELIELSKPLASVGLPYASHIRNEDNQLLESVEEALTVGREAGCPVQISHLKVQGTPNWHKINPLLEMIETASRERGNVHFDRYPYTAYSTGLSNLFPSWSREGGDETFLQRLQNQSLVPRIRSYVEEKVATLGSWHQVMITSVRADEDKKYNGWRMDDIARDKKTQPYRETVSMMLRNSGNVGMVGFGMSEENTERILAHPLCLIASDGAAMTVDTEGNPHPRNFGTFARVLGYYVREKKIFDLTSAVHKMTELPAEKLKLARRGRLAAGYFADVVVFDPDTITDTATYENPKQYSAGVDCVLVNGIIAVRSGAATGSFGGRILRST